MTCLVINLLAASPETKGGVCCTVSPQIRVAKEWHNITRANEDGFSARVCPVSLQ